MCINLCTGSLSMSVTAMHSHQGHSTCVLACSTHQEYQPALRPSVMLHTGGACSNELSSTPFEPVQGQRVACWQGIRLGSIPVRKWH